jgi:hypothetical protein
VLRQSPCHASMHPRSQFRGDLGRAAAARVLDIEHL